MTTVNLIDNIKENEGFSGTVYKDSLGYDTIGYGTKLPISEEEASLLLKYRLDTKIRQLLQQKPLVNYLSENRQAVLYEMTYQLGVTGILGFKKMWKALECGDYLTASIEMLDSLWAKQTPHRARKLAETMRGLNLIAF